MQIRVEISELELKEILAHHVNHVVLKLSADTLPVSEREISVKMEPSGRLHVTIVVVR